jgi:hypothetical protein
LLILGPDSPLKDDKGRPVLPTNEADWILDELLKPDVFFGVFSRVKGGTAWNQLVAGGAFLPHVRVRLCLIVKSFLDYEVWYQRSLRIKAETYDTSVRVASQYVERSADQAARCTTTLKALR